MVIPDHGGAFTDVLIIVWVREKGSRVVADEPIAEYEGGGQRYFLKAPCEGTLQIIVEAGETVPVGTVVAEIH